MPIATPQSTNRHSRLMAAVALPIFLAACSTDDSSLLDLESLFPAEVFVTANESTTGTGTAPAPAPAPAPLEPDDSVQPQIEDITTTSPSDQFTEVGLNNIPPGLQVLLRGDITFTSRFNGTGDPITDVFQFEPEDFELFPDANNPGALSVITDSTVSVCTFVPLTLQYLCLRSFDLQLQERVWHLFNLQTETNGSGVFEFCTEADTVDACSDKLFNNPDGTDEVTITPSLTSLAATPIAAPYFAYGEQGTVNRQSHSAPISESYSHTMNTILSTANELIGN